MNRFRNFVLLNFIWEVIYCIPLQKFSGHPRYWANSSAKPQKNIKVVGVFTFHIFSYHSQIVCFLYHFLWNYLMFLVILSVCRKTNILIFKRCRQTNLLDNLDLMSRKTRWVEPSLLLLTSLLLCAHFLSQKNSTVHLRLSGSILGLKRVGSSKTFGKTIFLLKIITFFRNVYFLTNCENDKIWVVNLWNLGNFFEN